MRQVRSFALAAFTILAATGFSGSKPADASDTPVLVELFTSQGCYSCPPADELLGKLAQHDDVVAISLHVDYWDYLGWRDTFAQRAFTERQYDYRSTMGARVVYTPQMIVHGMNPVTGSRRMSVKEAVERARAADHVADIDIAESGGALMAKITPLREGDRGTLFVAKYTRNEIVDIARGENGGKRLTYHNVVSMLSPIMSWDGGAEEVTLPIPDPGEGVAVWLQTHRTGPVLAAAKFEN